MNWREPFVALLIAFAVAAVLTPVVARFARVVGAVDRPRGRGLAAGGTPLLGGIAIFVAVTLSVLITVPDGLGILEGQRDRLHAILLGALAITVVGAIDDRFDLPWLAKLAGQAAAAWIPVSQGVVVANITFPWLGAVQFGAFAEPLTILAFVVLMNVVNFSDGIDGLAGGVSMIAAIAMGIVAWNLGMNSQHASLLAGATAGAALGFLVHNFHPARVFMGDTGALLLGYLLAAIAVEGSVKTNAVLALVVPFVVLALPMLDTTFVVLKRLKAGTPIYSADQNHFHHRLTRIGFSPRRTVLYLYVWAATLASVAVALRFVPYSDDRGNFDLVWTSVIVLIVLAALALSFYLVVVLEIVKLRGLDTARLRRIRPDATEQEIDADVAHALETGEFDAITGAWSIGPEVGDDRR